MKTKQLFLITITLLSSTFITKAQSSPEALLSQLPNVPTVYCDADTNEINRFSDRIHKIKAELKEIIDQIHAEAQNNSEKLKEKIVSNAYSSTGLNQQDINQLQNQNQDEEGTNAAIEKTVNNQYGTSLSELEAVGEMSEADQEKWAQQYANRMMTEAKKDPKKAISRKEPSRRLLELAKEEKQLGQNITSKMLRISKLFQDVDACDTIELRNLEIKMAPLEKQLCSGICTDAEIARSNAAEKQIYNLKIKYCQKLSPLQTEALSQYLTTLKSLLPDYRRLTEVQNEVATLQQIGDITPIDLSSYAAIDEYADALLNAYRFWIGKFE